MAKDMIEPPTFGVTKMRMTNTINYKIFSPNSKKATYLETNEEPSLITTADSLALTSYAIYKACRARHLMEGSNQSYSSAR
jgi:hypothetical protein